MGGTNHPHSNVMALLGLCLSVTTSNAHGSVSALSRSVWALGGKVVD